MRRWGIGAETDEIKSLPKPARGQTDAYGEWQGKALQAGIKALFEFGGWRADLNAVDPDPRKANREYLRNLLGILDNPQKRIHHEYRI